MLGECKADFLSQDIRDRGGGEARGGQKACFVAMTETRTIIFLCSAHQWAKE